GEFYPADCLFMLIHCRTGRKWLYEPCGILDGSHHAPFWFERQKCGTIDFRYCMCHSCYYGHSEYRKLEGALDYHFGDTVNHLFRTASGIFDHYLTGDSRRANFRIGLPAVDLDAFVPHRVRCSHWFGMDIEQNP